MLPPVTSTFPSLKTLSVRKLFEPLAVQESDAGIIESEWNSDLCIILAESNEDPRQEMVLETLKKMEPYQRATLPLFDGVCDAYIAIVLSGINDVTLHEESLRPKVDLLTHIIRISGDKDLPMAVKKCLLEARELLQDKIHPQLMAERPTAAYMSPPWPPKKSELNPILEMLKQELRSTEAQELYDSEYRARAISTTFDKISRHMPVPVMPINVAAMNETFKCTALNHIMATLREPTVTNFKSIIATEKVEVKIPEIYIKIPEVASIHIEEKKSDDSNGCLIS